MTRQQGVVRSAAGLIPFGHLGWGFRDRREFLSRAAEYIADGLARNQWVEFAGSGDRKQLRAELEMLRGVVDIDRIAAVTPALEFYGVPEGSDIVDPEIAVATRAAVLRKALDLGYTGVRAIVDATSVAERPDQREAFAHFEFLTDRRMAQFPVSALCAYDLTRLDADAASLICLHPLVDENAPTFRIFTESGADFALAGEIDASCAPAFTTAIRRICPLIAHDEVVIDAHDLDYISHRQLLELDHCARSEERQIVLRSDQPILSRLAQLLDLSNIRVARG